VAVGVAPGTPGVAFLGEPVLRLGADCRLGRELRDACLCGGQLVVRGGDVAVGVSQPCCGVGGEREGAAAGEPMLVLAADLPQGVPGPFVRVLGGVGGCTQRRVFRVAGFGGSAAGGAERRPERQSVVEPVGDLRDLAGFGGQVR
jgi:hypothetical protein